MAKKTNRLTITLACEVCKNRNYNTRKNKQNTPERLEQRRFCKRQSCRKHTQHKETK